MRFCTQCGLAQPMESTPGPLPSLPDIAPNSGTGPAFEPGLDNPLCWRCLGIGERNAPFCKFCGARYADGGVGGVGAPSTEGKPTTPPSVGGVAPLADRTPKDTPLAEPAGHPNGARLIAVLKDGSDGTSFPITGDKTDLGRTEGAVVLADDPYLSDRHARIERRGNDYVLRDLDSANGIYLRIREPVDLHDRDMLLLGQQVLRFELLPEGELPLGPATVHGVLVFGTPEVPRIARVMHYTTEGLARDVYHLYRDETVFGREGGDIVFTDDPFLSRRHASITVDRQNRRFVLRDLGSSNGTAIRFHGDHALRHGDSFRIGRHLFRFETNNRVVP